MSPNAQTYAAFSGHQLLKSGFLREVLAAVKLTENAADSPPILIFESETGRQVDFDLRGSLDEVVARAQPREAPPTRGRPKLGVESREVTLLPKHWEWLNAQPRGASATLRQLVAQASRETDEAGATRQKRDSAYRFMSALAGNNPHFEEAVRALYAGDDLALRENMKTWSPDIRKQVLTMLHSSVE